MIRDLWDAKSFDVLDDFDNYPLSWTQQFVGQMPLQLQSYWSTQNTAEQQQQRMKIIFPWKNWIIFQSSHISIIALWPISTKQMGKVLFSNPNVRFCTQELWETHRDIIPEIYSGFQPSNYYFCTVVEFFIKYEIGSVPCVHCSFDNQIIFPSNFYYTSVHRSINIFTVINLKYFTILYHL